MKILGLWFLIGAVLIFGVLMALAIIHDAALLAVIFWLLAVAYGIVAALYGLDID